MPILLLLLTLFATADSTTPAGAIEATIRGTAVPLEAELLLRDDGSDQWTAVSHQPLPAGNRQLRFDHLAPGVYQLRLLGPQPTERFAARIVLGTADTRRVTVTVTPADLRGRLTLGGATLAGGVLQLRHREFQWRTTIPVAADGTFRVPFWQRGAFTYSVRGPAMATAYSDTLEIDGDSALRVAIDIPDGRITGIVRDAKSGAAVAGATVVLETASADHQHTGRVATDREGRFDLTGLPYARHTVRLYSATHLDLDPVVVELNASQRRRDLDLRLDPGRAVPILALDADVDGIAGATVFGVAGGKLCSRATTDADGRATLALPENETATLFVVPAEGAFGVVRVPREREPGRMQIHLPRAASSLLIRARTTDGAAMPPFSLLLRYNGELMPPEVAEELQEIQGLQLATGPAGEAILRQIPAGSYEFWPYRTDDEIDAIIASGATFAAPIQVNVRTGENKIAVNFAAR